jgi:hypothetical protein
LQQEEVEEEQQARRLERNKQDLQQLGQLQQQEVEEEEQQARRLERHKQCRNQCLGQRCAEELLLFLLEDPVQPLCVLRFQRSSQRRFARLWQATPQGSLKIGEVPCTPP